jgi:hypothetical protein
MCYIEARLIGELDNSSKVRIQTREIPLGMANNFRSRVLAFDRLPNPVLEF